MKLLLLHSDIPQLIHDSFASDVIPVLYSEDLTKEQILSYNDITHLSFLYHYPGYDRLPFFDNRTISDSGEVVQDKYNYFSDTLIDIIKEFQIKNPQLIVDLLTCDLNSQSFKDEVATIETDLNVNIRHSVDKTGNPSSGANWVLESDNINIRDVYFTDNILTWNGVLSGDISALIKAGGNYSQYITWDESNMTYSMVQNFTWDDFIAVDGIAATSFIGLLADEIFDGKGFTIDLVILWGFTGLFSTGGSNLETGSTVKNLGILGGTSPNDAGFIIRSYQSYFKVENCYSTGGIRFGTGGIVGRNAGSSGNCTITNCYSTGAINSDAGGIAGWNAGNNGRCTITNCYSTGTHLGERSGGIVGLNAGIYGGNCIIENCYSTGAVIGQNAGGITGSYTSAYGGNCTITNCYSTGAIGLNAGGIVGPYAAFSSGTCTIENCYSTGAISTGVFGAISGGGITGERAGIEATVTITNCISNTPTIGRLSSSTVTSTDNSIILSDLNTVLSAKADKWLSTIWADGVLVNTVNLTLPILKGFQITPWISDITDSSFYDRATVAAQFDPNSGSGPEPTLPLIDRINNLGLSVDDTNNILSTIDALKQQLPSQQTSTPFVVNNLALPVLSDSNTEQIRTLRKELLKELFSVASSGVTIKTTAEVLRLPSSIPSNTELKVLQTLEIVNELQRLVVNEPVHVFDPQPGTVILEVNSQEYQIVINETKTEYTYNSTVYNVGDSVTIDGIIVTFGSLTTTNAPTLPLVNGMRATNVTVNFNVEIDASGQIQVFGTAPTVVNQNVVIPSIKLPVNALYDTSAGLIEFYESSTDLGDIHVRLADTTVFNVNGSASYEDKSKKLAKGLEKILVDSFDCSAASPYAGVYSSSDYYVQRDFGRLALSTYAHYLFGHVAATAAITNDKSFIESMLSISDKGADGTTATERYAAWTKSSMVDSTSVLSWDDSFSMSDANLAVRLVKAIVNKGLTNGSVNESTVNTATDSSLSNIVKQVIGQDATRAMGQDNNALSPDIRQLLRFYEGDKIAVNIRLPTPSVIVASGSNAGAPAASLYSNAENYSLLIELGAAE